MMAHRRAARTTVRPNTSQASTSTVVIRWKSAHLKYARGAMERFVCSEQRWRDSSSFKRLPFTACCIGLVAVLASCGPGPTGSEPLELEFNLRTVGTGVDLDGYSLVIDSSPGVPLASNGTTQIPDIAVGTHEFEILGIADNCRLVNDVTSGTFEVQSNFRRFWLEVFCLQESPGRIFYTTAAQRIRVRSGIGELLEELPVMGRSVTVTRDGERIAYDFEGDIWSAGADGSNPVNLTNTPESTEGRPNWSPDGQRITYHRSEALAAGYPDVYVINDDGSGATNLTPDSEGWPDGEPAWSPDGSKIVFRSYRTGNGDLYTISPDGTELVRLTEGNLDTNPRWSPDGQRIVFTRYLDPYVEGSEFELFVINADGSALTQITDDVNLRSSEADWSPDGDWLIVGNRELFGASGGVYDLYAMRANGTDIVRLTFLERAGLPSWIP